MIRHLPLLLVLGTPVFAATDGPSTQGALDALVRQGKDLYLGEIHGTAEAPALVRCLVLTALEHPNGKLIVSLEQQDWARDPASEAWRGVDGRGPAVRRGRHDHDARPRNDQHAALRTEARGGKPRDEHHFDPRGPGTDDGDPTTGDGDPATDDGDTPDARRLDGR